jgi:hypothetical protein
MRRVVTPEHMDEPGASREDLDHALRFIRVINRRLGGAAALIAHLRAFSRSWPPSRPVTLIDVATGSADIPVLAVRWARSRGLDLRVTAIDAHPVTLDLAREHLDQAPDVRDAITLVHADALRLVDRFGPASFDYAHAGMFLHHLSFEKALTVLRIMDRLARRGLVVNDLHRSRIAAAGIRLLTLTAPPHVRHDARVSVRAGFTRAEALDMAARLDLTWCRYRLRFFEQRFTLAGERPSAWKDAAP